MTLCQVFYRLYQAAEQLEAGVVWKVVDDDSETDDEDFSVVKEEDGSAEDDLVEDPWPEAVHRLPCLSPLSNLHADVSPWELKKVTTPVFSTLTHAADELFAVPQTSAPPIG